MRRKQDMMKRENPIVRFHHKTVSEKITYSAYFVYYVFMALVFLFPVYSTILTSMTTMEYIITDQPHKSFFEFLVVNGPVQLESWKNIIDYFSITPPNGVTYNFLAMLGNSVWFTVAKVTLSLFASAILAYAAAKFNFPGKRLIYLVAVFVQTIPIFGSGTTSYKLFDSLNMLNNPTLFWVAWVTGFDFTFIIMHGAFSGISDSYSEAARIDGASNWKVLIKIIFPMVLPILLALWISNSVTVWNDYTTIMVYLNDFPTLGYGLYLFNNGYASYCPNAPAVAAAATILSMLPIVIIYAASQKLILTNISVGGLKG
ncbi:MAG: carbohydrate ABC transporter permease [Bacilli bacterium]|nr:carbohydrate ABC transporter permease [Bacilli bacterium]